MLFFQQNIMMQNKLVNKFVYLIIEVVHLFLGILQLNAHSVDSCFVTKLVLKIILTQCTMALKACQISSRKKDPEKAPTYGVWRKDADVNFTTNSFL